MSKTLPTALQVIREYQQQMQTQIIPERQRRGTLAREFGGGLESIEVESMIFAVAHRLMPEYRGGFWDFVKLANGGFYLALRPEDQMLVSVEGNGFGGPVSGDAVGMIVSMMTYSTMSFATQGKLQQRLVEHFHRVREYALEHPESLNIMMAID